MNVLLAVTRESDPRAVGACLARRFSHDGVAIDVMTVLPSGREKAARARGAGGKTAEEVVAEVASELRRTHRFRTVRPHVERGDPAERLLAASVRLRSRLVLIEAPRDAGMLTAFRFDGVTRRLFGRASCPVELLRPRSEGVEGPLDVLVVIGLPELDAFPGRHLRALPWAASTRLHLLGVLPPAVETSWVEASSLAVLRSLRDTDNARARAEARMGNLCEALSACGDVQAEHSIVEGTPREVAVAHARRTNADLIVLASAATDKGFRGTVASLSPAAIALSASCSVLLLGSGASADASSQSHEADVVSLPDSR